MVCSFLTLSHLLLQKLVAQMKQDPQVNPAGVCVNEIIVLLMTKPPHAHFTSQDHVRHLSRRSDLNETRSVKVLHESVLAPTNSLLFSERRSEEAAPRTSSEDHSAQ